MAEGELHWNSSTNDDRFEKDYAGLFYCKRGWTLLFGSRVQSFERFDNQTLHPRRISQHPESAHGLRWQTVWDSLVLQIRQISSNNEQSGRDWQGFNHRSKTYSCQLDLLRHLLPLKTRWVQDTAEADSDWWGELSAQKQTHRVRCHVKTVNLWVLGYGTQAIQKTR